MPGPSRSCLEGQLKKKNGGVSLSQTQTSEHLDRLSHDDGDVIPARIIPQPYGMSVVSESVDVYAQRSRPVLQTSSLSEPGHHSRNILNHRLKAPETDKKSFFFLVRNIRQRQQSQPRITQVQRKSPHLWPTRPDFKCSP
ncbi:hypothetical protein N7G274_005071 [Stereocaulon virgatum]|uniref:Uncharacterized protein n=1 Tax=Stereocaulon virgatum TaxID=373712 RepID=A0ABR4AAY9_9LECA